MCSKKRPNNATSNYLVSMRAGDLDRNSTNFLGKLRANFVGTEFQARVLELTSPFLFAFFLFFLLLPIVVSVVCPTGPHPPLRRCVGVRFVRPGGVFLGRHVPLCTAVPLLFLLVCSCVVIVVVVVALLLLSIVAAVLACCARWLIAPQGRVCILGVLRDDGDAALHGTFCSIIFVRPLPSKTRPTQVFDDGYSPKEQTGTFGGGWGSGNHGSGAGAGNQPMREELGCVMYASNVLGSRGPRKMQVRGLVGSKGRPCSSIGALPSCLAGVASIYPGSSPQLAADTRNTSC